MSKRLLPTGLVLAASFVILWLALAPSGKAPSSSDSIEQARETAPPGEPSDNSPTRRAASAELNTQAPNRDPGDEGLDPERKCALLIEVRDSRGRVVPGASVSIVRYSSVDDLRVAEEIESRSAPGSEVQVISSFDPKPPPAIPIRQIDDLGRGEFRRADLEAGAYKVSAYRQGWGSWSSFTRLCPKQGDAQVRLIFEIGLTVSGRVIDTQRRGVARAILMPGRQEAAIGNVNVVRQVPADEEGYFLITQLRSGPLKLEARGNGFGQVTQTIDVPAEGLDDVEIMLGQGRHLRGRVRDEAGHPLSAWTVLFHGPRMTQLLYSDSVAVSDSEGRFEMHGLREDITYRVLAKESSDPSNRYPRRSTMVEAPPGKDELELIALSWSKLSGRVSTSDERAVPEGCMVSVDKGPVGPCSDGTFELTLDPGNKRVTASATGYLDTSAQVVVESEKTAELNFTLEPLPRYSIKVIDKVSKAPIEGVAIQVSGFLPLELSTLGRQSPIANTVPNLSTDARGMASFAAQPEYFYRAAVEDRQGYAPAQEELSASKTSAVLRVESGVLVSGRVDDAGGTVVAILSDLRAERRRGGFGGVMNGLRFEHWLPSSEVGKQYLHVRAQLDNGQSMNFHRELTVPVGGLLDLVIHAPVGDASVNISGIPDRLLRRVELLSEDGSLSYEIIDRGIGQDPGGLVLRHVAPGRYRVIGGLRRRPDQPLIEVPEHGEISVDLAAVPPAP